MRAVVYLLASLFALSTSTLARAEQIQEIRALFDRFIVAKMRTILRQSEYFCSILRIFSR